MGRKAARYHVGVPGLPQEQLIGAVVRSVLPERPALDVDTRAAVEADVTRLVATQIGAMPGFLRLPYRCALLGFELLPVLRWGRTFRALDAERRRAWVALWDERGLGPMHAFVKLVRSCTLLGFYDHPRVAAALAATATAAPVAATA